MQVLEKEKQVREDKLKQVESAFSCNLLCILYLFAHD